MTMDARKTVEKTLTVDADLLLGLHDFITQPDTRLADVFAEQNFPVSATVTLNWLIKHDLFEGVVMHMSLIDMEAYRHLGGQEVSISAPEDIYGDYRVSWAETDYILHILPH